MDLEDDTHMSNVTQDTTIVNIPVSFTPQLMEALVDALLASKSFKTTINNSLDDYFRHEFDINDHMSNFDFTDVKDDLLDGLVEDVISNIKDRL
jgi:hypothetical protein